MAAVAHDLAGAFVIGERRGAAARAKRLARGLDPALAVVGEQEQWRIGVAGIGHLDQVAGAAAGGLLEVEDFAFGSRQGQGAAVFA